MTQSSTRGRRRGSACRGGDIPFELLEGSWPGTLIVIEFPGRAQASAWYRSDAYQAIAALRTDNSESDVIVIDGVSREHKATDVLG